jgi:putative ABC transport system permease protein
VSPLLWRSSLRHLVRHPWQIGLAVLGIALGVAVALSIDLAAGSARRAFELSTEAVTGRATHHVLGGPSGLDEDTYRRLRVDLGVGEAAPVVAFDVAAPEFPGRAFHVFGVDPLAERPFRPHLAGLGAGGAMRDAGARDLAALSALLTRPGTALLSSATGRALGLGTGSPLTVRVAGVRRTLIVIGWMEPTDAFSARALESLVVTDIATAQEVAGAPGVLSRIDLIVSDDAAGRALLDRIRSVLPPGAEVVPAGAHTASAASMTAAFTLNLAALSLLALVVGMFLIYNSMTFSVVQRRPLIGTLRALGVTRREVFAVILLEALVVGAVGTGIGTVLGIGLARGLLGFVTRTINDLYFVLSVRDVSVTATSLLTSAVLGIGVTVAAAIAPALEAAGARPREALSRSLLEARARRAAPRLAAAGLLLAAGGTGVLLIPGAGVGAGFVGLFALLMAAALATPGTAVVLLRAAPAVAGRAGGLLGRMAARAIVASLSRTGVAMAALMVAVSATVGVGMMIASFRTAVSQWLEGTLRADVYVSPPSLIGNRPDATLDPRVIERLVGAPDVAGASTTRAGLVAGSAGSVRVVALGLDRGRPPGFVFREGQSDRLWPAFDAGAVIVSEPLAYRRGLAVGDVLQLRTDRGEHGFPVAGVFLDYGSSAGTVVMSRRTYERWWDDRGISALALYAAPGADVEALIRALRERVADGPDVVIRSNLALRRGSLEIFDRTFAITTVLRLLIVAVAFIGVLSALMALALERARETAVLRALGLTPRQVWGAVTAQTGLMGAVAGLLALPVGIMLAAVLVFVINRRSFGWTMPLEIRPAILLQGLLLAVVAALVAGLYPARIMAATPAADALRDE